MHIMICHLYISPGHNFFGHHGQAPGQNPAFDVPKIECVAGRGIRGDRFFDHKENYKGQITFFAQEVYDAMRRELGGVNKSVSVLRRNVITRGVDLNDLIDRDFEVQGVRFRGASECSPCYWMNAAFASGAEEFLKGRGGLRAIILTNGSLHTDVV